MVRDDYRCPKCGRVWLSWPLDESEWTWHCWFDGTPLENQTHPGKPATAPQATSPPSLRHGGLVGADAPRGLSLASGGLIRPRVPERARFLP